MATTSFLCHSLGLRGYRHLKVARHRSPYLKSVPATFLLEIEGIHPSGVTNFLCPRTKGDGEELR